MYNINSPTIEHRKNIGEYSNKHSRTCLNQKQQDDFIGRLARRPGLHQGNIQRQNIAQSMIQCLAFLTSIRNCDILPSMAQNPNIQVKNELPTEVKIINISQESDINSVLTPLTWSANHVLERAARAISQYDPLRFPMAEAAFPRHTLANPVSISDFKKAKFLLGKFPKLRKIKAFKPDGKFYDPNTESPKHAKNYMKVKYRHRLHIIKENKPGEYYLFDPNLKKPWDIEIPVYFETIDKKVHLGSDIPESQRLYCKIRNGRYSIRILGDEYLLNYNWHKNKPEIIINNGYLKQINSLSSGKSFFKWNSITPEYLEVYMEPLSETWHLSEYNGIPAFTDAQKNILNRISVNKDDHYVYIPEHNYNSNIYGSGIIFRAEKKNDYSHHTYGYFIEMNGRLIPVEIRTIPGKGAYYEIHDDEAHHRKKYLVQYINLTPDIQEMSFHYDVRSGKAHQIKGKKDNFLYDNKWVFK